MKPYPSELNRVKQFGKNMAGFVPLLYSLITDYRNNGKTVRNIVEIGVRSGTSTLSFLYGLRDRGNKNGHLYSIDIRDSFKICPKELQPWWTFIHQDSKTVIWNKEIDILLIDGDHTYSGVTNDYRKFEPFVREGGIILIHDVLWAHKPVIKFFWNEVKLPKSVLPLSKSGMGIIYKINKNPYNDSIIKLNRDWDKNLKI